MNAQNKMLLYVTKNLLLNLLTALLKHTVPFSGHFSAVYISVVNIREGCYGNQIFPDLQFGITRQFSLYFGSSFLSTSVSRWVFKIYRDLTCVFKVYMVRDGKLMLKYPEIKFCGPDSPSYSEFLVTS